MKKLLLSFFVILFINVSRSQTTIDTLAMQNFDTLALHNPDWTFTGTAVYNTMGISPVSASPASSPTGIANSFSWETTTQSGGLVLTFAPVNIPLGYDSVRASFSLASMNLIGTGGGPDNLDYVLVEVSVNGGMYYARMRIRGFGTAGCFWPFSAPGVAKLYYQPQSESVFAPTVAGLQTTDGFAHCEIVFPGSVNQVSVRLTGRSSSASDTWLIDNLLLTGEKTTTGINSISKNNVVRIYPNPANDLIQINRVATSKGNVIVSNALGEIVFTQTLTKETEQIDISSFAKGIYFFNVDGVNTKVLKQD